jgi:hypothetical protein
MTVPPEQTQRRTTRNISAPGILNAFGECAQSPWVLIAKSGDFSVEFDEGGGLKNRRLARRKIAIRQVLISRTLSVCGEVAERLKAAVC